MAERIKPPVLMSRLMIFVFAAMLVVLVVLFITLYKMFPLNRPQVFLLETHAQNNAEIAVQSLSPDNENFNDYQRAFVREYIRARNEIVPAINEMVSRWGNDTNGIVNTWSAPAVYQDFIKEPVVVAMLNETQTEIPTCNVNFTDFRPLDIGVFSATVQYVCVDTYNNGQRREKNYTIKLELENTNSVKRKWVDRINNPLGLRVSSYTVTSNNGTPLDASWLK